MPELPEVEIVRRSLLKTINKAKIISIKIKNRNLRYKIQSKFSNFLIGEKILNVSRRSKYLIFHFKEKILLLHLGMSGKILIRRVKDNLILKTSFYYNLNFPIKHNHVYFKLSNGLQLIYNDTRRFGFFKIYNFKELNKIDFLKKLGIEPFSKNFNMNFFMRFISNRNKNIKNLLMDQTFVSGLGNIYVNEILYMSKVSPLRSCKNLKKKEIQNLIFNTKKILKLAITKGGASIRDFKNTFGQSGGFQQYFYVYGKKNKRCSRISCNGIINKIVISNRSSFYCDKCQL